MEWRWPFWIFSKLEIESCIIIHVSPFANNRCTFITAKKGKSKGKVMSLSEFQGTSVPGVPFVEKKVTSSWADVMDGSAGE